MKIKFKKINENAKIPMKGSNEAGAFDVYASEIIKESDGYYIVSLGFSTEIPNGYRIMASGRSGLTKTNWYIPNTSAIIDSDYRGCWQIRFRGVPISCTTEVKNFLTKTKFIYEKFPFEIGDRVAQIYLEKIIDMEFEEVLNLENSQRGEGGFGSTGK